MLKSIAAALAALAFPLAAQSTAEAVKSPDGNVEAVVSAQGSEFVYEVKYREKALLSKSKLGLLLQGQPELGPGIHIVSADRDHVDESTPVLAGKANPLRDRCNTLTLELADAGEQPRKLKLEVRAYDDAVAFRYVVPQQESMRQFRLAKELTQFHVSKDATAYPLYLENFRTSYENSLAKNVLSRIPREALMGMPLLMEVPGVAWMAITEANLDQYAGMYLKPVPGDSSTLQTTLSPSLTEPGIAVTGALPHNSPWRVILIGAEPGRLIESNVILALNPHPAINYSAWIKPGKAAWSWWSGDSTTGSQIEGGMNTETMKYYIDFAAANGLEYVLIDAGWAAENDVTRTSPKIDMKELLSHAAGKKVRLWLWLHWTSVDRQMEQAFPLYEKWGIAGVKIDYMDSNDQSMVDFYHRVAKTAAAHHLMVDFHGAYPPTGMQRTYPNVLTHEGVLGLEYSKWSAMPDPEHNVMLAFTRLLAGPADYTPGGFENVLPGDFVPRRKDPMVLGTRAHQLALYVVFESALQMVADRPGAYTDQPAFDFIRSVPAAWDETRVVRGAVGQYVCIARRRGQDWYVGAITNWDSRDIDISLAFLGSGEYTADFFADAPDADRFPKNTAIQQRAVDRATTLRMRMAPGGGLAIRIKPKR